MNRNAILVLLMSFLGGCPQQDTSQPDEFIGTAEMLADGTLILYLRAEAEGTVGHGRLEFAKDDAQYEEILEHIGDMQPGDTKGVRPWPD